MTEGLPPALHVPARDIPVPAHLSPEAQASFGPIVPVDPATRPQTKEQWRAHVAQADAFLMQMFEGVPEPALASEQVLQIGTAKVYDIVPVEAAADDRRVYLEIHGGALVLGGGAFSRRMGLLSAASTGTRVWSVDYRMPPDHPYPAGLDDCVAAYRGLLETYRPQDIVIGGGSAGGNLAAATILRARDEGLPLPAAAILQTPELDLTESGDSFHTNLGLDNTLVRLLMPENLLYADGHDLAHPYLSPLFGDFSKGFPPTFISVGTRDLFLSNAVRMHAALRAADVPSDLYVIEAASHSGLPRSPEGAACERERRRFLERYWPGRTG